MNIPTQLTAGDSAQWHDDSVILNGMRYESGSYALTYELRGPTQLSLQAAADGNGWTTSLSLDQSQSLQAGTYWWSARASFNAERITIGTGQLQVQTDLFELSAGTYDGRTPAQKALSDAEAALADLSASGNRVKRYAIGDRNAEYYSAADLLVAINFWRLKVVNEQTVQSIANGTGNPRNLHVRFR